MAYWSVDVWFLLGSSYRQNQKHTVLPHLLSLCLLSLQFLIGAGLLLLNVANGVINDLAQQALVCQQQSGRVLQQGSLLCRGLLLQSLLTVPCSLST